MLMGTFLELLAFSLLGPTVFVGVVGSWPSWPALSGTSLARHCWGVQAAEVEDVPHEEGDRTCRVRCLCVRPEVHPLTTGWHQLLLGDE